MNFEYPNHLGDIVKNEAPRDTTELHYAVGDKSIAYIVLWCLKAIIILAKEIDLLKRDRRYEQTRILNVNRSNSNSASD